MAKPRGTKEIWVSCGITINIGNYESARIDAGISLPIAEGEDTNEVYQAGWAQVRQELKAQKEAIKTKENPLL